MRRLDTAQRHPAWLNVPILLIYLGLALLITWPLALKLGSEFAGARNDLWIHQWTFWWIKEALQSGQNPFYTTYLYFPQGVSLTSHNIAWFNIALWLPLQALFGAIAAYNLVFLAVITLNAFAFYLLAKAETSLIAAGFLGGLVFGFWPYTLSHFDHPNMMTLFWVPLTMYFLLRTMREQRWSMALLTAVSLALVGITRWQLLVMSAPLLLAYGVYLLYREREARMPESAVKLLVALGLAALLMAPFAAPLVLDQLDRGGTAEVTIEEAEVPVTDLLSYVALPDLYRVLARPNEENPAWDNYHRIAASTYYVPYIGLLTLALVLYGLWRQWSRTWFWLLVALGIVVLALGSELVIDGRHLLAFPMPYRLLEDTLVGALIRRPHRLNLFLSVPVAMIVAWSTVDIAATLRRRFTQRAELLVPLIVALLGALIIWENPVPPIPSTLPHVPQWYQSLAEDEASYGLLELPFQDRGFDKLFMYYQTIHGKPIMVGHVSRVPPEAFSTLGAIPFLEPLFGIEEWVVSQDEWVDFQEVDVTRQFQMLAEQNVRYVVVNKTMLPPGLVERWADWVTFDPVHEDNEVVVYTSDPVAGVDFTLAEPLGHGLGLLRAGFAPTEANHEGLLRIDLRWGSDAEPGGDYNACFGLRGKDGRLALQECRPIVDDWPTSEWGAGEVARGAYALPLGDDILPGNYLVELSLVDSETQASAATATLGSLNIVPFEPQHVIDRCWAGDLCLRGYDFAQGGDTLDLALYWQAERTLAESYKRFVHLVDPRDGRVVAQNDSVPRDWTYPTDIWAAQEGVIDHVSVPLQSVPPGEYEVRSGWYTVVGEERLPFCPGGDCETETAPYAVLGSIHVPAR